LSLPRVLYGSVVVAPAVLAELRVDSDRPGARALSAALGENLIQVRMLPAHRDQEMATLGNSESCA